MSLLGPLLPESWTVFYSSGSQFIPYYNATGGLLKFAAYHDAVAFADQQAALTPPNTSYIVMPVYYSVQGYN